MHLRVNVMAHVIAYVRQGDVNAGNQSAGNGLLTMRGGRSARA